MYENRGVRRGNGSAQATLVEVEHYEINRFGGSMGEHRGENEKVGELCQSSLNMLGNKGVIF